MPSSPIKRDHPAFNLSPAQKARYAAATTKADPDLWTHQGNGVWKSGDGRMYSDPYHGRQGYATHPVGHQIRHLAMPGDSPATISAAMRSNGWYIGYDAEQADPLTLTASSLTRVGTLDIQTYQKLKNYMFDFRKEWLKPTPVLEPGAPAENTVSGLGMLLEAHAAKMQGIARTRRRLEDDMFDAMLYAIHPPLIVVNPIHELPEFMYRSATCANASPVPPHTLNLPGAFAV